MSGNAWIVAALAAATGLIASTWSYLQSILSRIASIVIVRSDLSYMAGRAVIRYLQDTFPKSKWGHPSFGGGIFYVKPLRSWAVVGIEDLNSTGNIYWKGWRPIWLREGPPPQGRQYGIEDGLGRSSDNLQMISIRGMFNLEQLVVDAIDYYNNVVQSRSDWSGYRVIYVAGSAGKTGNYSGPMGATYGVSKRESMTKQANVYRYLKWERTDVGNLAGECGLSNTLALSPEASDLIVDARKWYNGRSWYESKGIPWRRGYLMHGKPGSGKTAIAQVIAELLNFQIFSYDLSSLHSDELREEWDEMLSNSPCMALIEDVDAVYDGRKKLTTGPSFDTLLNCIDGVQRSQGVLTVVTTNDITKLDPAFIRPGRIDVRLELGPMSKGSMYELCAKYLPDEPEVWDKLVQGSKEGEVASGFMSRIVEEVFRRLK